MGLMKIEQEISDAEETVSINELQNVLFATTGYEHNIRFWNVYNGACYRTIQHSDPVNALSFTSDRSTIGTAGHPHIKLYDLNVISSTPSLVLEGHTANVTSFGFYSKGIYSGSEDGTARLWDIRSSRCQMEFRHSETLINAVALHKDEREFVVADQSGHIRFWDLRNRQCILKLAPEGTAPIRTMTFSQNGTILVACNNKGHCFVWNITKNDSFNILPIGKIEAHQTYILKCAISPDHKWISTTSADTKVRIWSMNTFQLQYQLLGHQKWIWDCAFSHDSSELVTVSSDMTARLWNIKDQKCLRIFNGHHKAIVCLAFHDTPKM
jgi:G protein beta subunit-like protein